MLGGARATAKRCKGLKPKTLYKTTRCKGARVGGRASLYGMHIYLYDRASCCVVGFWFYPCTLAPDFKNPYIKQQLDRCKGRCKGHQKVQGSLAPQTFPFNFAISARIISIVVCPSNSTHTFLFTPSILILSVGMPASRSFCPRAFFSPGVTRPIGSSAT